MTILNTVTETFYLPYWSNCFLLFIIPFLFGIYYIYRSFSGRRRSNKERKKLLIIGIIIMAICSSSLLACVFRSNPIDIKKYQETWARHYNHLYRLQREMMRYLYGLDEYKVAQENTQGMANQAFMKKFFEIEDENAKKFVENMENKEIKITEGLRGILKQ